MAINIQMFKKRPVMWGIIAVIVFVLFYMLFSRGGGSGESEGQVQMVQSGPTDAQLAAQTQLGMAQIAANATQQQYAAEVAIANSQIQGEFKLGELAYQAGLAQINADRAMYETQSEYSLATARVAAENNLALAKLDKEVLTTQLTTQSQMFGQQLAANNQMLLIGQISTAKKKDRDNLIAALGGLNYRGINYAAPVSQPSYLPAPSAGNMM